MSRRAASAPRPRAGTVRSMTDTRIIRYHQLLRALADRADDDATAFLWLCATSLARYWELLHPETVLDRGVLHVPRTTVNGLQVPARQLVLPGTLAEGIRDVRATVYDLLGLPANRYGELVQLHRQAAADLELPYETGLEHLFVLQLEALVASATTVRQVQAILLRAGIPRNTKREHALRSDGLAAELAWITETTDRILSGDTTPLALAT